MKFFGGRPQGPIPTRNAWRTKVVSVVAEGDLVVVGIVAICLTRAPGSTYTTWFDMWRIQDGKADEHWDYGTITPPTGSAPAAPTGVTAK
jgi:predicted SnoaL-like aldol condensation-catalyzing enzyme